MMGLNLHIEVGTADSQPYTTKAAPDHPVFLGRLRRLTN